MTQIYQYAVAALCIEAVIIFFYFQKRSLPTFQNIIFLIILSVVTLSTFSELGSTYMDDNLDSFSLNSVWVLECLYFTFNTTFGFLFAIYNFSAFDIYGKLNRKTIRIMQFSMFIPYFICLILIWLSFALKDYVTLIFTIDLASGYQRGNNLWFYVLCITKAYYIILSFCVIASFHRLISKSKMQIMYFFLITISSTALIQLFNC